MNTSSAIAAILAVTMGSYGIVSAQGHGDRDRNDRDRESQLRDQGQYERRGDHKQFRDERRGDNGLHRGQRGAGPNHGFYRGQRLPMEYRSVTYVVDDWHGHRLSAPPRGYHWVQTGSDYVLVAIATGLILQIMLN